VSYLKEFFWHSSEQYDGLLVTRKIFVVYKYHCKNVFSQAKFYAKLSVIFSKIFHLFDTNYF